MKLKPDRHLARAKVNLYLHVTGRRADGYHLLDSLVVFAQTGDALDFTPAGGISLVIDGPFGAGLEAGPGNLVLRAALGLQGLCAAASGPARNGAAIRLTKNLPVASGIGGGSADAAATLRGLVELWQATPGRAALDRLAATLGADVPVCLDGRPSFVGGIGEDIKPAGFLPEAALLLVNPLVETPTPAVFQARRGDFSAPARWETPPALATDLARMLRARRNDLTEPATRLVPVIAEVLASIAATPGCLLARLSGSGATCFGLYESLDAAQVARLAILAAQPRWWAVAAMIAH